MKILFYGVAIFLIIQLIATLAYIPRIKLWFIGFKKQKRLTREKKAKFAVIIPARDESVIISRLFKSINGQTYPKEKFDVHIIVDDKEDKTVPLAKKMLDDPKIYLLENQKRKAEALDYCFKRILADKEYDYDCFIIVDADNVLTPDFLEEMNNALSSGADIIVPRKTPINREQSDKKFRTVYADCSASTFVGVDAMGNKGKCKKGYDLVLCGQGMLIKSNVIKKLNGYPFRGIIEDYEIGIECLREGYGQFYYEHAVILSEEPITRKEYNKRRIRWIKGFTQFGSKYGKEISKITKGDKEKRRRTFYSRWGLYPVYTMFIADGVGTAFFLITAIILQSVLPLYVALGTFAFTYLQLCVYGIAVVCSDKDVNKMTLWERIRFVLLYPFITMDYIWIFIVAYLTTKDFVVWEKVERLQIK